MPDIRPNAGELPWSHTGGADAAEFSKFMAQVVEDDYGRGQDKYGVCNVIETYPMAEALQEVGSLAWYLYYSDKMYRQLAASMIAIRDELENLYNTDPNVVCDVLEAAQVAVANIPTKATYKEGVSFVPPTL